jgi:hypothetical protein
MSKTVVYTGGESELHFYEEVKHVTVADGLTAIFRGQGILLLHGPHQPKLSLKNSAITTVGVQAFEESGTITLLGMEGARRIRSYAFAYARTCAPSRASAARRWA